MLQLTIAARLHAIDTKSRVLLLQLPTLDLCQCLDWAETAVLCQSHRYRVECVGERAHGVLLKTRRFESSFFDRERAGDFGGTASVDDSVVADEVTDHTKGVVD
jgi:hypothetical protein